MQVVLSKSSQNETLLVSFSYIGKNDKVVLANSQLNKKLAPSVEDKVITGKAQETVLFRELNHESYRHVLVVGLGKDFSPEAIRQAGSAALTAIKSSNAHDAAVLIDEIPGSSKKNSAEIFQAFTEGLLLTDYIFDELKSKKKDESVLDIVLVSKFSGDNDVKKAFVEANILSECVNFSRRLGDLPGNLLTPTILANEAVAAAKGTGIKATVWDKARIKKEKMGGLLGVSKGSDQEPRFIILEYKGAAASKKPVVFVGKGLTFDCGGISIKPSAAMEEMKYDMCGGAAMIGTLIAIAKLKLKVNAIALVPSTENLVGPSATKPGDVHVARNGKTFEVNNTDAEGRLILADALSYATELKPEVIFDAATLTGAMVVALGNIHTGYFTRDKDLKKTIEKAADTSGELVWNMPLVDHHVKDMKGTYADLSNISSGKGAGSATAAAFLEQFVGEGIPWAHFDIAGTGWAVGHRLNYCPKKGASGVMIRTLVELAKLYV